MALEEQFSQAQERVNILSRRPSGLRLLELYSLYKQATAGDVTGKRPGAAVPPCKWSGIWCGTSRS